MTRVRMFAARLVSLLQKRKLERELEEEIRSHIEMQAEDNFRGGMDRTEARLAAIRSFGGVDQTKEAYRDLRGIPVIEAFFQDIRYSFRALRQNPGFASTAIVSIALAIGANSAIFSFADGLLLRPLPVPGASEVVTLRSVAPSLDASLTAGNDRMSYPDFEDFRDNGKSFHQWIAFEQVAAGFAWNANAQSQLEGGYLVNGDFFRSLGIEPQLGRAFRPEEDAVPGRDAVIVLAHDLWTNEFAADRSIVGRGVRLNGLPFTIIGVAPESFTGMDPYNRPAFFIPIMMGPRVFASTEGLLTDRSRRDFIVKGRLNPGVSIQAAAREASALAGSLEQSHPATNHGFGATVSTEIQTRLAREPGLATLVSTLFVTVLVILLIACANLANLMLSRGRTRTREIAVRLALGASRRRIVRLLFVESLIIALASGVLALFVATSIVRMFSAVDPPTDIPIHLVFQLDERVVLYTALVSVAGTLFFGLLPALQSTRPDLVSALKAGESSQRRKRALGKSALVIVQIAGSLALLVGATQTNRAFDSALTRNPGFRIDHRITMRFDPSAADYSPAQTQRFYERLTERALEVTGVQSAGLTSSLPMTGGAGLEPVIPEGYDLPAGKESVAVAVYTVDHHYFETLGVPVLAGRGFRATDTADSPRVAVVNEEFARVYLGSKAVGKRVRLRDRNGPLLEIVGVAATGMFSAPIEPPVPLIHLPLSQNPQVRMTLIAEIRGDAASLTGSLREMVRSIDANMPIYRVLTMEEVFESGFVHMLRLVFKLQNFAGVLGLLLALVGLYAVVSYQVAQRTREIGIRMALGARRAQVLAMFLKEAAAMSVVGVSIGGVLAKIAERAFRAGTGMPAGDPVLAGLVVLGMLAIVLLAAAIPARRASRVDPLRALRQE